MITRTRMLAVVVAVFAFCLGLYVLRHDDGRLASLERHTGARVERDHRGTEGAFAAASDGALFYEGDGLRTGPTASASVLTRSGAAVTLASDTTVRFTANHDGLPESLGLDVHMGTATIRAGAHPTRLYSHVGLAVLDENSEVVLHREDDALGLEVTLGALRFTDDAGAIHVVDKNAKVSVGIGMALLDGAKPAEGGVRIDVLGQGVEQRRGNEPPRALALGEQELPRGTLLKLTGDAAVRVLSGDGQVLLQAPGTYRLAVAGGVVDALSGAMRLLAWNEDVRITVPGGVIIARGTPGGTEASLHVDATGGDVRVVRGEVSAELGGKTSALQAGESLRWPQSREDEGKWSVVDSLPFAHLRVRAGESFVVHAPGAPLAIGFTVARACSHPVELDIGNKRRVRGESGLSAAFGPGAVSYQVRCGKGVVARGRVTLLLDAGTRKLPSRAPMTDVDADGRAYSIYYQNQLPEVRVRWPGAPSSGPYTVEADGQSHSSKEASFVFSSGSLGDGTHSIVWSAGKRRSRPAQVSIQYDSAAPTASLSEPEDRGFSVGDTVRIRGDALRAWKVELENGTIERDAHDRFAGTRLTTKAAPDIAVRLSHPRHGVHYYVRRSVESP